MKPIPFQKLTPYIVGIILFFLITLIYFNPILTGKRLYQSDIMQYKGMSKEIIDYREKTGDEALWTNAMFGGMPAYQISVVFQKTILTYFSWIIKGFLPNLMGTVFAYFIGFFFLLLVLRVNPWLSIIGALAFGFSSYFFIIIEAGHNTKAYAIAYMAPVLAGIILAYKGERIWGSIITAIFLGLEIQANHLQITYYLLIIVLVYGVFEMANAIKEKTHINFMKSTLGLIIALVFAVLLNLPRLWTTYEYSKETIRGKSELTLGDEKVQTSGLDKNYATQWSYGIGESFSLMIPNVKGGTSSYLGNNKKIINSVDPDIRQIVGRQSHYWGDQPFTSGPVYVGIIIVLFFVFALFIVKGRFKWILLTATLISILLSWGKNFMLLTDFFLDYVPLYNKFRAVSMILVIAEFCIPLLAILAIHEIFKNPGIIKQEFKKILLVFGSIGGLTFLFYIFPSAFFNFFSKEESIQFSRLLSDSNAAAYQPIIIGIENARISIFKADVLRSLVYILFTFGLVYLYHLKKVKPALFLLILGVLICLDMIPVCYRYLNNDDFVKKSSVDRPFNETFADQEILKDEDENYRVLNLTTNTFNEAATSYFHKSIGGYHGAKLGRYQELIEYHIMNEKEMLVNTLKNSPTMQTVNESLSGSNILNMLNTRYFIYNPDQKPIRNPYALSNVWFVENFRLVAGANEEITELGNINLKRTAIIDEKFANMLEGHTLDYDSVSVIKLEGYSPNHLVYSSKTKVEQLAVFSEIYYDKGWHVFIDGKKEEHFRADYVLRAMIIPAGDHTIEFKFEPQSYFIGNKISLASSFLIAFCILMIIFISFSKSIKRGHDKLRS